MHTYGLCNSSPVVLSLVKVIRCARRSHQQPNLGTRYHPKNGSTPTRQPRQSIASINPDNRHPNRSLNIDHLKTRLRLLLIARLRCCLLIARLQISIRNSSSTRHLIRFEQTTAAIKVKKSENHGQMATNLTVGSSVQSEGKQEKKERRDILYISAYSH